MKLKFAALLLLSAPLAAQTIAPSQIKPSTQNGQVLSTVDGKTSWAPGATGVSSFGPTGAPRTGVVIPQTGDYTCSQVTGCISTLPSSYQTVKQAGTSLFQRSVLNFIPGNTGAVSCVDNPVTGATDCTFTGGTSGALTYSIADVTGSRAANTVYQNTTSNIMYIGGSFSTPSTGAAGTITVAQGTTSSSLPFIIYQNTTTDSSPGGAAGFKGEILPGYYYTVQAGGVISGVMHWTQITSTGSGGGGGGAVSSVSNSDGTLSVTPTTGGVVASLNLANTNTWTAPQIFPAESITVNALTGVLPIANGGLGLGSAPISYQILQAQNSAQYAPETVNGDGMLVAGGQLIISESANIKGGNLGSVPYQSAAGSTSFTSFNGIPCLSTSAVPRVCAYSDLPLVFAGRFTGATMFGDSQTALPCSTVNVSNCWPNSLASYFGYSTGAVNNLAVGGYQTSDVVGLEIFAQYAPGATAPTSLVTLVSGANEANNSNKSQTFLSTFNAIQQAGISWLSVPSTSKVMGSTFTATGTCANDTTYASAVGKNCTANGSTLTGSIITTGGPIYIWRRAIDGDTGTFTYTIDGGSAVSVTTAPPQPIASTTGLAQAPLLIRAPSIAAGTHSVVFTQTATGNMPIIGLGTPAAPNTVQGANPWVVVGDLPNELDNQQGLVEFWRNATRRNFRLMQNDKLPIVWANVGEYVQATTSAGDTSDYLHQFTTLGQAEWTAAFLDGLGNLPLTAQTSPRPQDVNGTPINVVNDGLSIGINGLAPSVAGSGSTNVGTDGQQLTTSSTQCTTFGFGVFRSMGTCTRNIGIGWGAGYAMTSGTDNVFIDDADPLVTTSCTGCIHLGSNISGTSGAVDEVIIGRNRLGYGTSTTNLNNFLVSGYATHPTAGTSCNSGTPAAVVGATFITQDGYINWCSTITAQWVNLQISPSTALSLQTNSTANALQSTLNFLTSTVNAAGLIVTPTYVAGGGEKMETTGTLNVANGGTGAATAPAYSVFGNSSGGTAAASFTNSPTVVTLNAFAPAGSVGLSTTANAAATSGANINSPFIQWDASYWNGASAAADVWNCFVAEGTGANPSSTFTCTHTGSTGTASMTFPAILNTPISGSTGAFTTVTAVSPTQNSFQSAGAAMPVASIESTSTSGFSGFNFLNSSGTLVGGSGYANASASLFPGSVYIYSGSSSVPIKICVNTTCQFSQTTTGITSTVPITATQHISSQGENVVTFSTTPVFNATFLSNIITLTASLTSWTLAAGSFGGQPMTLTFCQNATGSFTTGTTPTNVRGFFTIGSTASKCSSQSFVWSVNQTAWMATSTGTMNE